MFSLMSEYERKVNLPDIAAYKRHQPELHALVPGIPMQRVSNSGKRMGISRSQADFSPTSPSPVQLVAI